MFEQDYMMRMIKEMVRTILRLLFRTDLDSPTADLLKNEEEQDMLQELMEMVDEGEINEAENRLYEVMTGDDKAHLEMAILFYAYLNEQDDDFLEQHEYSREEIKLGIQDLTSSYGIEGISDVFLADGSRFPLF